MKPLLTVFALRKVFLAAMLLPSLSLAQAPANDECAGATLISLIPYSTSQNTRLATPNPSDPFLSCADGGGGKTVWFAYTADTTRYLKFSTLGSTPADYDVALALFTGTCGALVEVRCNDDAGGTRQSEIIYRVEAGTTYLIHIGEWAGGGPSGGMPTGGDLVFNVTVTVDTALAKGPRSGSVLSGVTVTTDSFSTSPAFIEPTVKAIPNNPDSPPLLAPKNISPPKGPQGSNYIEDKGLSPLSPIASRPVVLQSFQGIPDLGIVIPPDPIMAVGPNHVVACVNQRFRIWDKNGTILKTINSNAWFASALPGSSPFDPSVIYDHYAKRWIMVWDNVTANSGHFLISVSDDSIPLGTWYNWATPSTTVGDSVTPYWGDYPHVGYDDQAIYITSRQFPLAGGPLQYCKVRIIPKAQLYTNTAGAITWSDLWDLRDPFDVSVAPDGVMPTISYGSPGVSFLANDCPFRPGTYFTIRTISDPLGTPSITAVNVPVVAYSTGPLANQLGGSTTLIEAGGSRIRAKAIYRDSSLWTVHSVASGTGNAYSAVRYVRFNPFTATNLEDVAMGVEGYWHFYNALMVNENKDVVITFSRSGTNEYVGAFLSGRKDTDPQNYLSPSVVLKAGEANYVKTFGSGRNRWGDYNGIGLDPTDGTSIWAFTEYAASPANTWGTWVGKVKIDTLQSIFINVPIRSINFPTTEVGQVSDTSTVIISNVGADTLIVSNITPPDTPFILINPPAVPLSIPPSGTVTFRAYFVPRDSGTFTDSVFISSNDPSNPTVAVRMNATGFIVYPAVRGVMYATTGTTAGSRLFTIDTSTAATTPVGPYGSGYTQVISARPHPTTHEILGLVPSGSNFQIVRINSARGDAHPLSTITGILSLKGMAFRGDTLYIGRINGALYRVDINTGAATQVTTTSPVLNIAGLDFNPITGELWASVRAPSPTPDRIYKIALPSGAAMLVGSTGRGATADIIFDGNGNLFGITGAGVSTNSLIRIDTTNASSTLIGSMGIASVQALAMYPDSLIVGVRELASDILPVKFTLDQNYPNPFNPTTQIKYALPLQSKVSLSIFNLLGQEVTRLVEMEQVPGFYEAEWNGTNDFGTPVTSGLYFYRLEAQGSDGRTFREVKKMLLLK